MYSLAPRNLQWSVAKGSSVFVGRAKLKGAENSECIKRSFRGFPSWECKFLGWKGSFCCMKKGPENRKNEVKLHPPGPPSVPPPEALYACKLLNGWLLSYEVTKLRLSAGKWVVAKLQGDRSASQSSMQLYDPWISGPLRISWCRSRFLPKVLISISKWKAFSSASVRSCEPIQTTKALHEELLSSNLFRCKFPGPF